MDTKIKEIAKKIVSAASNQDIRDVTNIRSAVENLIAAGLDPNGSLTKISNYLYDFIAVKDDHPNAAWEALRTSCYYLIGEDIKQWKYCDEYEIFLYHAKQVESIRNAEEKVETEKLKRTKAIADAFASIGL